MNKKLQVFVSSTYTDLIDERQAAVEAILDAGHIPAGMELFKAGNESQLQTIYKWIDESDVYMLILGGRYGSVESKSGKSYTQLEYEYALNNHIPVFSVILSESFLTDKINSLGLSNVIEQKAPNQFQSFKSLVMSKIIREVNDKKDIKIAIYSTLNEFINEYSLVGWTRNNNNKDETRLLQTIHELTQRNAILESQLRKLQTTSEEKIGNYTFQELYSKLKNKFFIMNQKQYNALNCFIDFHKKPQGLRNEIFRYLSAFDLVEEYESFNKPLSSILISGAKSNRVTKNGEIFYSMLEEHGYITS